MKFSDLDYPKELKFLLYTLGGFGQVGRSSLLLSTPESKILIDCGINPGARSPMDAFPRLDSLNMTLDEIDAVVIGHAHLDHTGFYQHFANMDTRDQSIVLNQHYL